MSSTERAREGSDEPRWVAAVEPRFPPRDVPANGQQHVPAAPAQRVVYVEPAPIHDAIARYWFLILLIVAIGVAAGVAQAMSKDPIYSASARLGVGMTNVNTANGLGGFAASGPTLAAAYSRASEAQPVVDRVARKLDMDPGDVRGAVVASSIPETPVIRVDASSTTADNAIALANAMSEELTRYAGDTREVQRQGEQLLRRYRAAQRRLETMRSRVTRAEERVTNGGGAEARSALRSARADASAASLQVRTLGQSYESTQQAFGGPNPLQVLQLASAASSDERSTRMRLGFLGGAGGLVVGLALALLLANRRRRRALP